MERHLNGRNPEPFPEVDAWLAQLRRFWSACVDALERHLDRRYDHPRFGGTHRSTRTNGKTGENR